MIEFHNVSRIYNKRIRALDDVSLIIEPGEFVFLIGESGAGKSTLTKMLLREEIPDSGHLIYQGQNVAKIRRRNIPAYRKKVGVVFQDFRLLEDRNVYENISFALEIFGHENRYIKKRVDEMLELVNLKDRHRSFPDELSGGEKQRVSIARAMANSPRLLIADEPTGNLDPDTSWEIMRALRDINNTGTTVLMATHAKDIVDRMKKRVIALKAGKVIRDEKEGVYSDLS